ncbi:transcriptional regulator [Gottschalkia purinilytica]|uniref:Transcriptional regulator n=1 Tax=Gottschalkia purinilytica TaxID=1503 RepID=A0A0L0WE87_GOTPU|nr:GntR family transcriptional regulator [Gottschalkia purinilytica]KNF09784.1 transcriptional regulator [Gottschalkia purinilytica]
MLKDIEKINIEEYRPLRDIVFETLREAILNGKLKPGERVMEVQLAETLGVSRTPVREAIRKLELEGLLVMIPRKGAYVADVSLKDVLDVLEIRALLEGLAASLAAERMTEEEIEILEKKSQEFIDCVKAKDTEGMIDKDTEFHDVILRSAKNEKLTSIVEGLRDHVQRFRVIYFTEYDNGVELMKEHEKIKNAIKERESEEAKEASQDHIYSIGDYLAKKKTESQM